MASSTCSAMTVPYLPRSSRIVSTFCATRIRNSRSASRSDGPAGERRLLPLLVALADEVVDEDLPLAVVARKPFWPWRSMRPLRCSSRFGFHGIS